jgi:outer membrane protein TolC
LVTARNNPGLADIPGKVGVANANVLAAQILPNPAVGLGYAFLVSGPATVNALSASISQDVRAIITYQPRVAAAKARFGQVSASAVWDVWQVAQKGRLLAIDINSDEEEIHYRTQSLGLLDGEVSAVQKATEQGNLALTAEAPLFAARATAQKDLATARLQMLKDWQALDALMGLQPAARFRILPPAPVSLPREVDSLVATLPSRRPDLIALQLGYHAAEQDVRVAILKQFPPLSLGVSGGNDTSDVVSVGPAVTFDLPIFDRNQAGVATSQASRAQLRAEYQAALDAADGTVHSLIARLRVVAADLARARAGAAEAKKLLNSAQSAYQNGNLDQRGMVDYQSALLDRQLEVVGYQRILHEDALALEVELGLGLPQAVLGLPDREEIHS